MALTTRTHRVAVTAAPQLRTRVNRVAVAAVETIPITRVHRLSVTAVETSTRTRVHRLSVTAAPPPGVTLAGPTTTVQAGDQVTITATAAGATSMAWSQTEGWTVTRTDSLGGTTFKAPIRLSGFPVTIQADATNANGDSEPATIRFQVAAAPVAYWDGATLKPTVIDLHT